MLFGLGKPVSRLFDTDRSTAGPMQASRTTTLQRASSKTNLLSFVNVRNSSIPMGFEGSVMTAATRRNTSRESGRRGTRHDGRMPRLELFVNQCLNTSISLSVATQ